MSCFGVGTTVAAPNVQADKTTAIRGNRLARFEFRHAAVQRGDSRVYLREVIIDGLVNRATTPPPEGPGFSEEEVTEGKRLEVWATEISDKGGDYVEFRLLCQHRAIIRRIWGY